MAKSKFEYVKQFEIPDPALLNTYMVVRVDGKAFTRLCQVHDLIKPNDVRLLSLMNRAARQVMLEFKDIMLSYGQSDEYSFVFRKSTKLFNRRCSKILSTVVSLFTSSFVYHWPDYFSGPNVPCEFEQDEEIRSMWPTSAPAVKLAYPPAFDSRMVLYPTQKELRDYFSWRQADVHINNLYNTCFWKLVYSGMSPHEANATLAPTDSAAKNELLFSKFSTNYNSIAPLFRKGTTIIRTPSQKKREKQQQLNTDGNNEEQQEGDSIKELRGIDIISKPFWDTYQFLTDDNY